MTIQPMTVAPWIAEIVQCRDDHPDWTAEQVAEACRHLATHQTILGVLHFFRPLEKGE
jgi:hypothetical protein